MAMRVTFVLPDFEAGGAQRVIVAIANALDRTLFEPSILAMNDRGPWRALVANDISVTNLGRARLRESLAALRFALRQAAPDVIVSTIGYLNLGVLMSRPRATPVIVRESNTPHRASSSVLLRMAQRLAYAMLYRRADCVISPSGLIADELARGYHVPRHLIQVVRNPVDETQLRALASPPRRRPGGDGRFVTVGRLSEQKGYDRLLDALDPRARRLHISIFGEGEERGALEARSLMRGVADQVAFAGFEPNPAPWIAGADALLLPSRWEGLPNVALEALACGTPVIATPESGGIREIAVLARPGAVTIAAMGPDFLNAMAAAPRNDPVRLRESLLPDEFRTAAIVGEYQRQLQLLGKGRRIS
jgi:glycosyltransferase involved in cell wall biosynthesis